MKLSASYHALSRQANQIDEIRYPVSMLDKAIEDINKYSDKIIIIEILNIENSNVSINQYINLLNENSNLVLDCYEIQDFETLREKTDNRRIMYHYPAYTIVDLHYFLHLRPYAITIAEPLTFQLPKIRSIIDYNLEGTLIRVLPAIGRPSNWKIIDDGLKHFWIPPHLTSLYEDYIDVIDVYDRDNDRESALLDVYYTGKYAMPLCTLVKNCENELPCTIFDENFVRTRIKCNQVCMEGTNKCHYCDAVAVVTRLARPNDNDA